MNWHPCLTPRFRESKHFNIKCDVCCKFVVDSLNQIKEVPYYFYFSKRFFFFLLWILVVHGLQ